MMRCFIESYKFCKIKSEVNIKNFRAYNPGSSHPYHLVAVPGGGSTVYGWVNVSDV